MSFYRIILESLLKDAEASLRMLENITMYPSEIVKVKSSLRRAIRDAKEAMRGYEDD
jgi:hypothetical protein